MLNLLLPAAIQNSVPFFEGATDHLKYYTVVIRQLPEGVWLATSDKIPGLFVEGDTEKEARDEARKWAKELLIDNAGVDPDEEILLIFSAPTKSFAR